MLKFRLRHLRLICNIKELSDLPQGKMLINTINAYSYNNARKDNEFAEALSNCDALVPDGMSIVKACSMVNAKYKPQMRIAGWDLFTYEMDHLNGVGGKVLFLGSTDDVLSKIKVKASEMYPNIEVVSYSPPYKDVFSPEDNKRMIDFINDVNPDLLWIGMTAPKQEKWIYQHWKALSIHCHCGAIGAVFDFFAGTTSRAPLFMQQHGLEWLYRFMKEPRRLWKRYIIGNIRFLLYMLGEMVEKS